MSSQRMDKAIPSLEDLFSSYLSRADVASPDSSAGMLETYDAGLTLPVDTALAWRGALACLDGCGGGKNFNRPQEWPSLVQSRDSEASVAMAAGNFPQMLRDLPGLVQTENLAELRSAPTTLPSLPGLVSWAERTASISFAGRMLAAGVLRLAGQFSAAEAFLGSSEKLDPQARSVWQNERGALFWSMGDHARAIRDWQEASSSAPATFNLGMATLFETPASAVPYLQSALQLLADGNPWRDLAGIYLALAEIRS
jgi:hypothetical protein